MAQLAVPAVHSLISTKERRKESARRTAIKTSTTITQSRGRGGNAPVQVTPLPEYPVLQAQVNDPGVFVQVAVPDAQFEVPAVHSLMSIHQRQEDLKKQKVNSLQVSRKVNL